MIFFPALFDDDLLAFVAAPALGNARPAKDAATAMLATIPVRSIPRRSIFI